jgi:S1-C subfamily serine protease
MLKSPLLAMFVLLHSALAQVAPPKPETGAAHVKQSRAGNYSQRFEAIKCAIVQVFRGQPVPGTQYGTGFYVSAGGDVVTASHVLADRVWTAKDGGVTVDLPTPDVLTITDSSGEDFTVPKTAVEENREAWGADIALIKTGKKSRCWLAIGDDSKVKTGDHVITIGFPELAFESLSLYTGVVSAVKLKSKIPIGKTANGGQPVQAQSEFIRVQMPISGGMSGAPVVDDNNRAIAVVDSAGLWDPDLDLLIGLADRNQLGPVFPAPNTLNLAPLVGQLAKSFHQFASPGYGDSVPLSYLKKKATRSAPTSSQSDR